MRDTTLTMQPPAMQPFATWNPADGVWETSQLDLYGHLARYSETWPTSGTTHGGSAYPLPRSALPIPAIASSSWPMPLLRTPLATDAARGSESLDQVKARRGTVSLSHQVIDLVRNGPPGSHRWNDESDTLWHLIADIFNAGEHTHTPSPDGSTSPTEQHHSPRS